MSDDGFHEIQLNGKQLVFLFMATTVVSVVIFLCGVLVGRGVRAERGLDATELTELEAGATEPLGSRADAALEIKAAEPGAPGAGSEELTYPKRLEAEGNPAETLTNPPAVSEPVKPPAAPPATPVSAPGAAVASLAPKPDAARSTEGVTSASNLATRPGFTIQVAALRERAEAEAIAKRLTSKGYETYIVNPAGGSNVYRVRVGRYPDRKDAEPVVQRLATEEQFKPWITR
jgi:cell division septation protein DedD